MRGLPNQGDAGRDSLDRPREVRISADPETGKVTLAVQTKKMNRRGQLVADAAFAMEVTYDEGTRMFTEPRFPGKLPRSVQPRPQRKRRISKKEVRAVRFPQTARVADAAIDAVAESIYGQERMLGAMRSSVNAYMATDVDQIGTPQFLVIPGFTGTGKSDAAVLLAKELGIPYVQFNLQSFSGSDEATYERLVSTLSKDIAEAKRLSKANGKGGHYFLIPEEMDKIPEIVRGVPVDRQAMAVMKDIMNQGEFSYSSLARGRFNIITRDALTIFTMNFPTDHFGLQADPRITTIEDMQRIDRELNQNMSRLRGLLGTMFRPETVGRMLTSVVMSRTLDLRSYRKIINKVTRLFVRERFENQAGENISQIYPELTPAYRRYLERETIVPSEGGRHTAKGAQMRIRSDVERAMKYLPHSGPFATAPLTLRLDYKPRTQRVFVTAVNQKTGDKLHLLREKVNLTFPPA